MSDFEIVRRDGWWAMVASLWHRERQVKRSGPPCGNRQLHVAHDNCPGVHWFRGQ